LRTLSSNQDADHVSGAPFFKNKYNVPVGIGKFISAVQEVMSAAFNIDVQSDGSQFDELYSEGDEITVGNLTFQVMHTPGHTPACVSYYIPDDCVFVGDTVRVDCCLG
jgi:glyoxylase-like metal-dependent hydrolase (beta-lactamase superfamily II)